MQRNKVTSKELSYLVPHQANERILESVAQRLKLPKDKVIENIAAKP